MKVSKPTEPALAPVRSQAFATLPPVTVSLPPAAVKVTPLVGRTAPTVVRSRVSVSMPAPPLKAMEPAWAPAAPARAKVFPAAMPVTVTAAPTILVSTLRLTDPLSDWMAYVAGTALSICALAGRLAWTMAASWRKEKDAGAPVPSLSRMSGVLVMTLTTAAAPVPLPAHRETVLPRMSALAPANVRSPVPSVPAWIETLPALPRARTFALAAKVTAPPAEMEMLPVPSTMRSTSTATFPPATMVTLPLSGMVLLEVEMLTLPVVLKT